MLGEETLASPEMLAESLPRDNVAVDSLDWKDGFHSEFFEHGTMREQCILYLLKSLSCTTLVEIVH